MKCKYCGFALSNSSATCPHCGMLMTEDQLRRRKELNGYNNPYMERLNRLNKEKEKYNLEEEKEPKNINGLLLIIGILVVILIIAFLLFGKG